MKRYSILPLAAALALALMAMLPSCGKTDGGSITDSAPDVTTAAATESVHNIDFSGYPVIIEKDLMKNDALLDTVNGLTEKLSGAKLYADKMFTGDAGTPAILIGNTVMSDLSDIAPKVRNKDFYIGVRGESIVIYATTPDSTARAVRYFSNTIMDDEKTTEVPSDLEYSSKGSYAMNEIKCCGKDLYGYRIVLPAYAGTAETNTASELRYYLAEKYGYTLEIVKGAASGDGEIVIGGASDSGKYDIKVTDGGIHISADGMLGYEAAWNYFRSTLLTAAKNGDAYSITSELSHSGSALEAASMPAAVEHTGEARVMFYNIYSQGSLNPGGLRTKMELEIIKQYTPDVLGFQEFHPVSRMNGFLSGLTSLRYAEVKVTIDTSKNKKNNNYTPLFYRADLLEVEKSGYLLYDGLNDSYSKGLTWAVFKNKQTGYRFCAISTHYWWKSQSDADNASRISDSEQLLAVVREIYSDPALADVPLVAGGDLNCRFSSDPIKKLTSNGLISAWGLAARKNDSGGHHAYPTYNEQYGLFTEWGTPNDGYTARSIDHAFVKGNAKVTLFHTLTDRYALIASDHCPLIIDISR